MKAISKEADYMYVAGYENCSITLRMFKKIRRTNFIWTNFIQNAMYMNLLDNKAADIFMVNLNIAICNLFLILLLFRNI